MNIMPDIREPKFPSERRTPLLIGDARENFREPSLFIEEIHARAETVTPLLREILEFHPPPHWEICE